MKMNWSANNLPIIDIYHRIKQGTLETRPFYQRRLVWTLKDKEWFIDTILHGYPFPEVYFCQGEIDTFSLTSKECVVDGQQRLTTIVEYIDGNLNFKNTTSFESLPEKDKREFLNYKIVIRNLGSITDDEIKEIFYRLNRTDYNLNQAELLYAQFQGEYISVAKQLVGKFEDFFDILFGEKSISRMNDLDFVLQIMTTIENGIYFSGNSEVERYVRLYNDEYENKDSSFELLSSAFDLYHSLKLNNDSLFRKKAACFSLLVELCKICCDINSKELLNRILNFEKLLIENKEKDIEKNNFARFYNYLYQGTASRTARDFRGQMIRQIILG